MRHRNEMRDAHLFRVRRRCWCVVVWVLMVLSVCTPAWATEDLTVLVMTIEREETSGKPAFTRDTDLFPQLVFDNPEADWLPLKIGDHYWLCGELEAFAESNDITVHVRFVRWNEALDTIIAQKDDYDVVQVPSTWTAHLIEQKVLAKWDGLDTSLYEREVLKSCSIEGQDDVYAVPWQIDLRVLYYRDELTDDPSKLVTYGDFVDCLRAAKELAESDASTTLEAPFGVGAGRDWDILHGLFAYYTSGQLFKQQDGQWRPIFHEGAQRGGIKNFNQLSKDGLVSFRAVDSEVDQRVAYGLADSLAGGKVLAVFGGPSMRADFADRPDIHAVPLPQLHPGEAYSFLGGCNLAVSAAAYGRGNDGNARELVRRLTGEDAQRAMADRTDALPANTAALNAYLAANPRWQAFGEALKHGVAYPSIPPWAEFESKHVRDGFDILRLQFERGADWDSEIAPQLDAIAAGISPWRPPVPVAPTPPMGFWAKVVVACGGGAVMQVLILAAVIVAIVIGVLTLRATGVIIRATDRIENDAKQAAIAVGRTITAARDLLAGKLDEQRGAVLASLESMQSDLRAIQAEAADLADAQSEENTVSRFLELEGRLGQVEEASLSVDEQYQELHEEMAEVLDWIRKIRKETEEVAGGLGAADKPPLDKCTMRADFGYERKQVTLQLSLWHGDQRLGESRIITGPASRLFEEVVWRHWVERKEPGAAGAGVCDYVLAKGGVGGQLPDRSINCSQTHNTLDHFIHTFQSRAFCFVSVYCDVKDARGKKVKSSQLLFMNRTHLLAGRRPRLQVLYKNAQGTIPSEAAAASSHRLIFVAAQRFGGFKSNLMEAEDKAKKAIGKQVLNARIAQVAEIYSRSRAAWQLIRDARQKGTWDIAKEYVDERRMMLEAEQDKYDSTVTMLESVIELVMGMAKAPTDAEKEAREEVLSSCEWGTKEFRLWAGILGIITAR